MVVVVVVEELVVVVVVDVVVVVEVAGKEHWYVQPTLPVSFQLKVVSHVLSVLELRASDVIDLMS